MAGGGGGAWKVAYADFVTAMMALFMVLWISAQDEKILIATSKYFQSPFSSPLLDHSGIMPFNKQSDSSNSSDKSNDSEAAEKSSDTAKQIQLSFLNSVAADFYRLLNLDESLERKPIDVQVTSDGLRITLFDRAQQPLFHSQSTDFTEWGIFAVQSLAWMIDRHQFRVTIDGHDRMRFGPLRENYTVWELSADRANAARRVLVHFAVEPRLIQRVTGYADTQPLPDEDPAADSNQRITLSLSVSGRTPLPAAGADVAGSGAPSKPGLAASQSP
jgi:chemotaxis protein MotB